MSRKEPGHPVADDRAPGAEHVGPALWRRPRWRRRPRGRPCVLGAVVVDRSHRDHVRVDGGVGEASCPRGRRCPPRRRPRSVPPCRPRPRGPGGRPGRAAARRVPKDRLRTRTFRAGSLRCCTAQSMAAMTCETSVLPSAAGDLQVHERASGAMPTWYCCCPPPAGTVGVAAGDDPGHVRAVAEGVQVPEARVPDSKLRSGPFTTLPGAARPCTGSPPSRSGRRRCHARCTSRRSRPSGPTRRGRWWSWQPCRRTPGPCPASIRCRAKPGSHRQRDPPEVALPSGANAEQSTTDAVKRRRIAMVSHPSKGPAVPYRPPTSPPAASAR